MPLLPTPTVSTPFFYLDRLVRAHHHALSLQNLLKSGKLFSSANRALSILNSTFCPAFASPALLSKFRHFNSGFIQSQILLLVEHYRGVMDDALSHLPSLPISLLLETLPSVFKSIQRKTKLSVESRQFALCVLYQLQTSSTLPTRSCKVPKLLDLKPRPTRKRYFDSIFHFLDKPRSASHNLKKSQPPLIASTTTSTQSTIVSQPSTNKPSTASFQVSEKPTKTPLPTTSTTPSTTQLYSTNNEAATTTSSSSCTIASTPITTNTTTITTTLDTSPTRPSTHTTTPTRPKSYFPRPETQISVFHRKGRSTTHWTLPALKDKTVFIGDSNLSRLQNLPNHCHAFSFSGANIDHLHALISKYSHTQYQPTNILFSIGINNRDQNPTASSIPSIKKLISKTHAVFPNAHILIASINFSPNLNSSQRNNLKALNAALKSIPHCNVIPPLDNELFSTGSDNIHWSFCTASLFLSHWLRHLNL